MSDSTNTRYLVVNADDFGHSPEVNAGIVEAHERGIVTSASLMVRRPAAEEAVASARRIGLGLHVELGEWAVRDGSWTAEGTVPEERVETEVRSQLGRFRRLVGRDPTHLDSHQHVHREGAARRAVVSLGRELGVPVRDSSDVRYVGGFYGQTDTGEAWPEGVTVENLIALLHQVGEGVTELGCHPARGVPPGTSYAGERELELAALCDPAVQRAIEQAGIELISFGDLTS